MSTPKHQSPPLPVGLSLDRGFALLRTNPRALLVPQLVLGVALTIVLAIIGVLVALLLGDVAYHLERDRSSSAFGDSTLEYTKVPDFTDGQVVTLIIGGTVLYLVYTVMVLASVITVVRGADRAIEGRDRLPLRAALKDGVAGTPKLFGIGLVFSLMAFVVYALIFGVAFALGQAASGLGVLVGLAGFCLLIWLAVRFFLWPFVQISENTGFSSFGRAWNLSRGRFWSLFGILVLVSIVVTVVFTVLVIVLALVVGAISSIGDAVGVAAFIPYAIGFVFLIVVASTAFIAPMVVSYRTLAGRDNADLWLAASAMGGGGTAPPADPAVRRWDAAEDPLDGPAPGWAPPSTWDGPGRTGGDGEAADAPPPSGSQPLGGLPPSDERTDAERRWGRGDEPPAS